MGERIPTRIIDYADNCRNCGMCRIDYLGTGRCHAAEEHVNFGHHPHGRLKIFRALQSGELPLTTETQKVIDSCTLCGACNIQCYFQIEMAPMDVFETKRKVFAERAENEEIVKWASDDVLDELIAVVGDDWAFNDPTILAAYTTFGSLNHVENVPMYVALPKDAQETAEIIKIANKHKIKFLPISSGTNSTNIMQDKIIMIDMGRMKHLEVNKQEEWAEVGAGIMAFDLQKACMAEGMRFSIGESAAGVCGNQVSTGIHSFFGYKKGMMADHYIEAEFVTMDGQVVTQTSDEAPGMPTKPSDYYQPSLPCICTKLRLKIYPVQEDETIIFIPFREMDEALDVTRELAEHEIGAGMGLLGIEVLSEFLSITEEDAENFLDVAQYYLKINYATLMMLTQSELAKFEELFPDLTYVKKDEMQRMIKGIPAITGPEAMAIVEDVMDDDKPYDDLFGPKFDYFLQNIELSTDEIETLFEHIDSNQLKRTLNQHYFDPEYNDPEYWFNYRMFSPRFLRKHWFFSIMYFVDGDKPELIEQICEKNAEFGEQYDIEHHFCYIMPMDGGKRFFLEYEYFANQRDEDQMNRLRKIFFLLSNESRRMTTNETKGVYPVMNTLFNGLNKRQYYLYSNFDEEK
ncbi:FAD-binding oxidoreductase [Alteromonas sp. a30]|uniref:FAD-binding oxidoreductase n=1 Tax=Alteromonas sp. a30 TaxID=2730917 RepID=UPI00227F2305|nr:FAD-binding protein [Alteromonas sp. a30]MCY7296481.1 FAD-binding protein [Alteromonas sp. a30]